MFDDIEIMIYNLSLRVIREYVIKGEELKKDNSIKKSVLENEYNFRKKHIRALSQSNIYFIEKGDKYFFTEQIEMLFNKISIEYQSNKDCSDEKLYKREFQKLKEIVDTRNNSENFREQALKMIEIVKKLHWKYLPIFSDHMLRNRGYKPENDLTDFYYHYHPLERLVEWIDEDRKLIKSKFGDINLDKKITVEVYSQRWKSVDHYQISRTLDGWKADFMMVGGEGNKEGESILECLRHDSISFPESINYYFSGLWDEADTTEMAIEDLEKKLKKIFNWINVIEISKPSLDESEPDNLEEFNKVTESWMKR